MKILLHLALLIIFSCARINQDSREKYKSDSKIRHGVIPIDSFEINKSERNLSIPDKKTGSKDQRAENFSISRGKDIYVKHCLSCHGDKGLGNGPDANKQSHTPANLQKLAREVPNFKFFISISQWDGGMPGWKDQFNDSDRDDLVSYIKTFR